MKKYISRSEAAEMLGVTPQTVSNYIARKILRSRHRSDHVFISRDDVEALMGNKDYQDAAMNLVEIQRLKEETERGLKEARERYGYAECETNALLCVDVVRHTVGAILGHTKGMLDNVTERQFYVLSRFLNNISRHPYRDAMKMTTDAYDITPQRVRQIVNTAALKLSKGLWKEAYCEVIEDNARLRGRCDRQHYALKGLQEKVDGLYKRLERYEVPTDRCFKDSGDEARIILSNISVMDVYLLVEMSVRAINCLKLIAGENMYDILRHTRTDVLKYRTLGKKSLVEIEEVLRYDMGVGFGGEVYDMNILRAFYKRVLKERRHVV